MTRVLPPLDYVPPIEDLLGLAYEAATGAGASNGAMPRTVFALGLVDALNWLANQGRVIPAQTLALATSPDRDDADAVRWRTRYRSSQNGTTLFASLACAPASTINPVDQPDYSWDAGGTPIRYDARDATPADVDVRPIDGSRGRIVSTAVARDTVQTVNLSTDDWLRICGLSLWEKPRPYLDTATDLAVAYERWRAGEPIYDADIAAVFAALQQLWETCHKQFIAWRVADQTIPRARVPNTPRNIFDQTLAAYGANTPGWPLDIAYCRSLSQTTYALRVAVYAGCAGAGGTVRLAVNGGNTDVAVGAPGWYEQTITLAATDTKLDVMIAGDAANACELLSVCAWGRAA